MSNLIEYSGVDIHRNEHVALKDVNLKVGAGEFIYLIGRVGSGKTSLLKTLYAEVPVSAGSAMVFDYDLQSIKPAEVPFLRREIGIVFQDFQLLNDRTAYDNLDFVLRATGWKDTEERRVRIDAVLRKVGMHTKAFKMPHQLSGGEQQRIVIARALLNKPRLILADEPTGNLDPETGEQIMTTLHDICRNEGTTVIVATHNLGYPSRYKGRILKCEHKHLSE